MIDVAKIREQGNYRVMSYSPVNIPRGEKQVLNLFYDVLREAGVYDRYCETRMPAVVGNVYELDGKLTRVQVFVRPGRVYFLQAISSGLLDKELFLDKLERLWSYRHHKPNALNVELEALEAGNKGEPAPENPEGGCMTTGQK